MYNNLVPSGIVAVLVAALSLVARTAAAAGEAGDQYVSKAEYENLKQEFKQELEGLKLQMRALQEGVAARPKRPQAAAPSQTPTERSQAPAPSQAPTEVASAAQSEQSVDREQESEEAQRQVNEFLRRQRLLFGAGEIELEFGASYSQDTARNTCLGIVGGQFCAPGSQATPRLITRSVDTNLTARYGLTGDLEFDLAMPFTYVEQELDFTPFVARPPARQFTRTDHVGISDLAWALRYSARREDGVWPDVVLSLNVKTATGDKDRGLGTGNWNIGGNVTLVKTIDPVVLFGSLGYTGTLESEGFDRGDEIPYALGMGFSLNDKVSFTTSLVGAAVMRADLNGRGIAGSGKDFHTLQFATTVRIDRGLFVEPFVGFGLVEDSTDFIVGLNVPFHVPERLPLPFFH